MLACILQPYCMPFHGYTFIKLINELAEAVTAQAAKSVTPTSFQKNSNLPFLPIPTSFISTFPSPFLPHLQTKYPIYTMPTSQQYHISLRQQYHHLRRDWDNYKTSIPRHRWCPSVTDLPSSAVDFHTQLLQISPKKLIAQQHNAQTGRALIKAFDKVKEKEAVEMESPLGSCDCCSSSSSSSPLARNMYMDEGSSSSDNGGEGSVEKDTLRVEKHDEWMERLRLFGIAMVAVFVGVFSFAFLFGVEDASQLMTPT